MPSTVDVVVARFLRVGQSGCIFQADLFFWFARTLARKVNVVVTDTDQYDN